MLKINLVPSSYMELSFCGVNEWMDEDLGDKPSVD